MSNLLLSTGEDVATSGLLFLALAHPVAAIGVAGVLAAGAVAVLLLLRKLLGKLMGRAAKPS